MLKDILPEVLNNAILGLKYDKLCEIRVRNNKPVTVNYLNSYYYLGESGIVNKVAEAIMGSRALIDTILHRASNFSLYAINDQLKSGFVSVQGGIRIGVCGDVVEENGQVHTLKNFSAINIRIPHQIFGCSLQAMRYLFADGEFLNTLVIASPGVGKTTFIRDVCFQLSEQNYPYNILLLDERGEIASCVDGEPQLDIGKFTDIITGGTKYEGFINGIRSMSPSIICTDEIGSEDDIKALDYAMSCGVKMIATVHAKNMAELQKKPNFKELLAKRAFKRFVLLTGVGGKGTLEGIFDENLMNVMRV